MFNRLRIIQSFARFGSTRRKLHDVGFCCSNDRRLQSLTRRHSLFSTNSIDDNDQSSERRHSSSSSSSSSPSSQPISTSSIDESFRSILEKAADVLPSQAILSKFVHKNPLHSFESMHFDAAVKHVQQLERSMSVGDRVFALLNVDPRSRASEALVDLCAPFLDRGGAKWAPDFRDRGFLYFFATLEDLGRPAWRRHAREMAKRILEKLDNNGGGGGAATRTDVADDDAAVVALAESILRENLALFGVPHDQYIDVLRSMMLELRGWAGMFRRMELHPRDAPLNTKVRLIEFCAVHSILRRSSIEHLAAQCGWSASSTTSLAAWLSEAPTKRQFDGNVDVEPHPSAIAYVNQTSLQREESEREFQQALLRSIEKNTKSTTTKAEQTRPMFQLYACIDEREESLRSHVERANAQQIETFGVAGFFGIPIRYRSIEGTETLQAPDGSSATGQLVERACDAAQFDVYRRRRRWLARVGVACERASFGAFGSLLLASLGMPLSLARLALMAYSPDAYRAPGDRFASAVVRRPPTDIAEQPYAPAEAAQMLARTFADVGHTTFAPIVVVLGHGASSVNNPFAAAYNCGACGGREGGPNARLFARLANDRVVRAQLALAHGIAIPADTHFVGALHDTTTDDVAYFDVDCVPDALRAKFDAVRQIVDDARAKNALERAQKFLLARVSTPAEALRYVRTRSNDAAEVRPELNHASNAAVVVGRRELTRGSALDRRVFLPSYDPSLDDERGTVLERVLSPALSVGSGISLEYLFSTTRDVVHHGAGTKVPLNVVGHIGVLQGTAGDLRTGLPSQMTEMHTPLRALYVVDAPVARVEAVLARRPELARLVRNEWVRFVVRDPSSGVFYQQRDGRYEPIDVDKTTTSKTSTDADVSSFAPPRVYGMRISQRESVVYYTSNVGVLLAAAVQIYAYADTALNPHGIAIALGGTMLALPTLAFARRYLHGEYIFGRFSMLCVGLAVGFDLVAMAPSLELALAGWTTFGFASTFLIGMYNDRPTVRNNATFAFGAYQLSNMALLVAAACSSGVASSSSSSTSASMAAGGLLVAALLKSSQVPFTALFARSMEGPMPSSALAYAGLSAHLGVVLLSGTMPLWFGFEWARIVLASVGALTTGVSSLQAHIRADRKGAIAHATSATLGLVYVTLAAGYAELALLMSLAHAAFRIVQTLRSPNVMADTHRLRAALADEPHLMTWHRVVPRRLYRVAWAASRVFGDINFVDGAKRLTRHMPRSLKLTKFMQYVSTTGAVLLAGIPFTPLAQHKDQFVMQLLHSGHSTAAVAIKLVDLIVSVLLIRFVFTSVLSARRFRSTSASSNVDNK